MGHIDKFNQLATRYDTPNNIKMAQLATEAIRPFLNKNNTKTAADLGCGTGLVGLALLNDVDSIVFVDGSEKMLELVETKLIVKGAKNASVLLMDMEPGAQLPSKVDTIIMSLVLHHISNRQELLSNLYDNLNDNGQLLIIDMAKRTENTHAHDHGMDRIELATELQALGYKEVQSDVFYDAQKEHDAENASRFIISARINKN